MSNQSRRLKEYTKARNDGFILAMSIIEKSDLDDRTKRRSLAVLRKEARFRKDTLISTNLTMKELEEASGVMRGFLNEGHILIRLSVLHDEFDFGAKRLNQAMDRFDQIYTSIQDGYAGYHDYVKLLEEKMKKTLKTEFLVKDGCWEVKHG